MSPHLREKTIDLQLSADSFTGWPQQAVQLHPDSLKQKVVQQGPTVVHQPPEPLIPEASQRSQQHLAQEASTHNLAGASSGPRQHNTQSHNRRAAAAVMAKLDNVDASRKMHDYLLAQQRRKEEFWLRKYGKVLSPPIPSIGKPAPTYEDRVKGSGNESDLLLPPIRSGGRGQAPMFEAKQPIKSFPMKGSNYADRRHKANIPYHPAVPTQLPPIKGAPRPQDSENSPGQQQGSPVQQHTFQPSFGMQEASAASLRSEQSRAAGLLGEPSAGYMSGPPPFPEQSHSSAYSPGQHYEPMSPSSKSPKIRAAWAEQLAAMPGAHQQHQQQQPGHAKPMRDLQLELSVLKAIKSREDVLDRLKVACDKLEGSFGGAAPLVLSPVDPLVRLFYRLVATLRQRTLDSIEAIAAWRRKMGGQEPFVYYGVDYLANIGPDLAFLDGMAFLRTRLNAGKATQDPFLVDVTPDGIPIEEATTCDLRRGGMRFSSDALRIRMARKVLHQYGAGRPASAASSLSSLQDDQYQLLEARPDITSFLQPVQQYAAARQPEPELQPQPQQPEELLRAFSKVNPLAAPEAALPEDPEAEEREAAEAEEEERAQRQREQELAEQVQRQREQEWEQQQEQEERERAEREQEEREQQEWEQEEREQEEREQQEWEEEELLQPAGGEEEVVAEEEAVAATAAAEEATVAEELEVVEEAQPSADILVVQHRTPEQSADLAMASLLQQSHEVLAFASDDFTDDGQFIDYAIDVMVESLQPTVVDTVQPFTFTVAGWEIDRQLDDLIGGLEGAGMSSMGVPGMPGSRGHHSSSADVLLGSPRQGSGASRGTLVSSHSRSGLQATLMGPELTLRPGSIGASRLSSMHHAGDVGPAGMTDHMGVSLRPGAVPELEATAHLMMPMAMQGSIASRSNRSRVRSAQRTTPPGTGASMHSDWTVPNNERDGSTIDHLVEDLVDYVGTGGAQVPGSVPASRGQIRTPLGASAAAAGGSRPGSKATTPRLVEAQ